MLCSGSIGLSKRVQSLMCAFQDRLAAVNDVVKVEVHAQPVGTSAEPILDKLFAVCAGNTERLAGLT